MAPGVGALPAAEREVPVVEPLVRYLEALPPSAIRQIRLALRVFEWLPFPWRFSRASLEAREQFLREMDGSRFSRFQDLLLFMKVLAGMGYGRHPRVRDAIGYSMRCEVAEGEPPAPDPGPSPLGDLEPPEEGEECDVAIIGSGAGGAVAATILAEAGLDVVVLEAGPYLDRRTYPSDPLEALTTLYRDGGLTVAQGKPSIPVPIGRAVGGTTVINSGTCFRAPQSTLQGWREDFGVEWATELDADYAEAEEMLRVTPVDTERMGRNGQLVMEGAAALGGAWGSDRAQPADPPGVLDRRALRRGGARLGRGHAELLRRRVGGDGPADGGHVHAACVRRPVAARHRSRAPGANPRVRPGRLEWRPPQRPLRGPGRSDVRRRGPGHLPAGARRRPQARVRDRPGGGDLLRRGRPGGLLAGSRDAGAEAGSGRRLRGCLPARPGAAARGLPPDGNGADVGGSRCRRNRPRWLGPRHGGAVRRRREPVSNLDRGQSDDDRDRVLVADLAPLGGADRGLTPDPRPRRSSSSSATQPPSATPPLATSPAKTPTSRDESPGGLTRW